MTVAGNFRLGEGTTPAWAGAGVGHLYFDQADGNLYFRNSTTGAVTGPLGVGGGGGTLQQAYDAGTDIVLDASGAVSITDAATNPDGAALLLTSNILTNDVLQVARTPAAPSTTGNGVQVSMGANSAGTGVLATAAGDGRAGHFIGTGAATGATKVSQAFGNANPALDVTHGGSGDGILVSTFSGSGVHVDFALNGGGAALDVDIGFSVAAQGLDIQQGGAAAGATIAATNIGTFSNALNVSQAGTASGISVTHTGTGSGIAIDTTGGGGGDALNINALGGEMAIRAKVGGVDVLRVDDTALAVGAVGAPLPLLGYASVQLGTASGTQAKAYEAFTTDAATTFASSNNRGRIVTREGVNTALNTVAELAFVAGTAGETLLTKGGRLYAQTTMREYIIATGVTLSAGDVVSPAGGTGTIDKADPVTANGNDNAFGVVIVGDGPGDGTKMALVAIGGYAAASGLTGNTPVYLDDTIPGLLTSTVPSTVGRTKIRIGFALTQNEIIIHVGEKVAL